MPQGQGLAGHGGKKIVWYAFRELTYFLKMSECYNGGLSRLLGFPGGSDSKESACNVGDPDSIPRSGRSPGEDGNPLQYSCLENHLDRGEWWATLHGVAKSWTQLNTHKPSRVLGVKRGALASVLFSL